LGDIGGHIVQEKALFHPGSQFLQLFTFFTIFEKALLPGEKALLPGENALLIFCIFFRFVISL